MPYDKERRRTIRACSVAVRNSAVVCFSAFLLQTCNYLAQGLCTVIAQQFYSLPKTKTWVQTLTLVVWTPCVPCSSQPNWNHKEDKHVENSVFDVSSAFWSCDIERQSWDVAHNTLRLRQNPEICCTAGTRLMRGSRKLSEGVQLWQFFYKLMRGERIHKPAKKWRFAGVPMMAQHWMLAWVALGSRPVLLRSKKPYILWFSRGVQTPCLPLLIRAWAGFTEW